MYRANLSLRRQGKGVSWQLNLAPEDGGTWRFFSSSEGSGTLGGWQNIDAVKLFHADNIRGVAQNVPLLAGSYFIPFSEWVSPLNNSRWQGFPGMWLMEEGIHGGLVYGVLTQAVWKHMVHGVRLSRSQIKMQGRMSAPGILARTFAAGETYQSEILYLEWTKAETPSAAFAGYLDALHERLEPCKFRSLLRKHVSWGSWNDRKPHFWDVSQDLILRTMQVLKDRFPAVRIVQIDDGYADGGSYEVVADRWTKLEHGLPPEDEIKITLPRRLGAAFMHEPGHAIARDRFPVGMGPMRNEITQAGFVAGIWLGLNVIFDASVAKDHPDWFVYAQAWPNSDPELQTFFGRSAEQGFRILDPSVPAVREYIGQLAKLLCSKWGYTSLKLDFWSYAFEADCFRLRFDIKTAYEWRSWLFSQLRSELGSEGFLTIACDISTGSPFICEWVDNVRYGIDIGNGRWENIKYTALTGTFLLHVEAYRFYLMNSDSVGLLEGLPENERRVFIAWASVTRSVCEVAGDLSRQDREKLRELQKVLLAPRNGNPAYVGEQDHLHRNEPAGIVWTPGDLFSSTGRQANLPNAVLAVFNWSDSPRTLRVDPGCIAPADSEIIDVEFFESKSSYHRGSWDITLPPRSVHLSQVTILASQEPRVVESAWEIRSIEWDGTSMTILLQGDAISGLLLYWPSPNPPLVESSLPVQSKRISEAIVSIAPILQIDEIHYWELGLSNDVT